MALAVADIVTEAGYLLNDVDGTRWTTAKIHQWISECHIMLVADAPAVCVERGVIDLAAGPVQTLDDTLSLLMQIVGISDASGIVSSVVTECTDKELFLENPAWMSDDAATPVHFAKAAGDIRKFYLYPFLAGTGYALADYVSVPVTAAEMAPLTAAEIETPADPPRVPVTTLTAFSAEFLPIFVDYVLYRCFGEDSDNAYNMQLSVQYFGAYQAKLSAYANALGAVTSVAKLPSTYRREAPAA